MRIFTALFLIASLSSFAQTDKIGGVYFRELGNDKHHIEYTLNLNQDSTFTFQSVTNTKMGLNPKIELKHGKGTWKLKGKVVSFHTDKGKDLVEKYTLDFTRSKARFITKSPRDISDRIIKTRLKFFKSEIFWIEGLDIFRN